MPSRYQSANQGRTGKAATAGDVDLRVEVQGPRSKVQGSRFKVQGERGKTQEGHGLALCKALHAAQV